MYIDYGGISVALTAMDIYKQLPKTNCGDCGVPTCLAFAMKLAQKQASLDQCPHVTDEAKAALEGSAAPPMKTVTIGEGDNAIEIGGETVLFRHEETFHHPIGIAIEVSSALDEDELRQRIETICAVEFDRVGMLFTLDLIALDGQDGNLPAAAAIAAEASSLPLILISEDIEALRGALEACADKRPLIYAANADNMDAMTALAKEFNCPLVVRGDSLEQLFDIAEKAIGAGIEDLVLDTSARDTASVLQDQTAIRRAAINEKVKPLGFPTIGFTVGDDDIEKVISGCTLIAKYAGIVVTDLLELDTLLPLITARLNIYTDPQKPIQVESGVYEVGQPDASSPVLITTNFSLTYYTVEADVSAGNLNAWIVVVDTAGTSVLTAWAAEDFTPEIIAKTMKECGIEEKVDAKIAVLPGGVAVLSGDLEQESGWKVVVGPRESSGIPAFLKTEYAERIK